MTIAPWLQPPDFLGAAKSGAALALQRSELGQRGGEAAGRLRLGFAQLAQEAGQAAAANELRRALGLAELDSRENVARINAGSDSAAQSLRAGELGLSRERLGFEMNKAHDTLARQLEQDQKRGKLTQQQAVSYGTRLLGLIGNYMTDPETKASAMKNYYTLQSQFPDVLSPLAAQPVLAPTKPTVLAPNAGASLFNPANWFSGGEKTNAAAVPSGFKILSVD